MTILAVFYVCMGASIDLKTTPYILKKGGTLFGVKVVMAIVIGVVLGRFLGESPVAGGFFAGPWFTLGAAGLSAFPWQTLLSAIIPLIVGTILGGFDPEMRKWLRGATPPLIPFFAFALGAGIDLAAVEGRPYRPPSRRDGLHHFCRISRRRRQLTGGRGVAGNAAASTADNAAALPAIVAAANPAYKAAAGPATILVAASVLVTSVLVPFGTAFMARSANR